MTMCMVSKSRSAIPEASRIWAMKMKSGTATSTYSSMTPYVRLAKSARTAPTDPPQPITPKTSAIMPRVNARGWPSIRPTKREKNMTMAKVSGFIFSPP